MNAVVHLAPHEFAPDHPCTDPDLYEADEQLLAYMLQDLRALVRRRRNGEVELAPYEVLAWSVHDLARRQVICDPAGLEEKRDVCIVGFFGERRGNPETQPRIDRLESALHEEFRDVPGVLSYSSIELVDDYWANLVVHSADEDREVWRNREVHREAAEDASPEHYRSVRIHHGVLADGVCSSNMIRLVRTKYWDYGDDPALGMWMAERELVAPIPPMAGGRGTRPGAKFLARWKRRTTSSR